MRNLEKGRYKVEVVEKLDLYKKHAQVCIMPAWEIFEYLEKFMKENISEQNWNFISCSHEIEDLEKVDSLIRYLKRRHNMMLKVLYENPKTGGYGAIPFHRYEYYCDIELYHGKAILVLDSYKNKDIKHVLYKVKKFANENL